MEDAYFNIIMYLNTNDVLRLSFVCRTAYWAAYNAWPYLIRQNFEEPYRIGHTSNDYQYNIECEYFWKLCKTSTIINMNRCNIKIIPDIWTDVKCHYLLLNNNKIRKIPDNWQCTAKNIQLDYNLIEEIPENWNITTYIIKLNNNYITEIPPLWNPHVDTLSLVNNMISEIPEYWNITVDRLFLSGNCISKIPKVWNPTINTLYLDRNQIKHLPKNWHPNIKNIYLYSNPISQKEVDKFRIIYPDIKVLL